MLRVLKRRANRDKIRASVESTFKGLHGIYQGNRTHETNLPESFTSASKLNARSLS